MVFLSGQTRCGDPSAPSAWQLEVITIGVRRHATGLVAADIARAVNHAALRLVVAAHLSERNNRPALAQQALGDALGREHAAIGVADPLRGTDWLPV
jgi:hypothetical protein